MKKIFTLLFSILISTAFLFSQDSPPQALSFQAVILGAKGKPVNNSYISLRISILQSDAYGSMVYQERHTTMTSNTGGVNIEIGQGSVLYGYFEDIPWEGDRWYLFVEVDPKGGTNYVEMTRMQMLSVPFALYAGKSGTAINADHATNADFATIAGSVVSYTETDPVFSGSPSAGITEGDKTNWDEAHSWGDHGAEPYLIAEVDGDVTNEIQDLEMDGDILNITNDPDATGIDLSPYQKLTESQVEEYAANDVASNYLARSMNGTRFAKSTIYDGGSNIGIGTTNPTNRLDVNGNIKASYNLIAVYDVTAGDDVIVGDDVIAGDDVFADDFRYNNEVTKYLTIPANAGNYSGTATSGSWHNSYYSYLSNNSVSRTLYFNVDIPLGATIKGVRLFLYGNGGTTSWYLRRISGGTISTLAYGTDNSAYGTSTWTSEVAADYTHNIYSHCFVLFVNNFTTTQDARVGVVQIRYVINEL